MLDYFQSLPNEFVQKNPGLWETQTKAFLPQLLQKKQKNIPVNESKKAVAILIEMGKKDPHLIAHPHFKLVLSNDKEFSPEVQGIALTAIGTIYGSYPEEASSVASQLYSCITPKLETFKETTNSLLTPILKCFPFLCEPSKLPSLFPRFVEFAASDNPDLSSNGLQGIQSYLLLMNCQNFIQIVSEMVNLLRRRVFEQPRFRPDEFSTHLRNLYLIFNTFLNKFNVAALNQISSDQWKQIRLDVELCSIYCLIHQDPQVIKEALNFLAMLSSESFSKIDSALHNLYPYLNNSVNLAIWTQRNKEKNWTEFFENFLTEKVHPWITLVRVLWNTHFKTWDVNDRFFTNFFILTLDVIVSDQSKLHFQTK